MIQVYTLSESIAWDTIVAGFTEYDIYYLSGYVRSFMLHGDGEPLLFYYDDGETRGINVVMKRDIADLTFFSNNIPQNTYFDFATPYGYGGWLVEGKNFQTLFSEYENWCLNHNIVCEFVRYHPVLDNAEKPSGYYENIALGKTICLDLNSEEQIWTNITSKNRNMIRKAQKNGLQIGVGNTHDLYRVFIDIYNKTMDDDCASNYYYFKDNFYNSIYDGLPQNSNIFYAYLESGEIVAAAIMLYANNRMNYHLSGSLKEYQHLAPTNLLLYKAAVWGSEHGYKTFHLGGGVGSVEDGLFRFKKSFYRGEGRQYHVGRKVFLCDVYNKLVDMRGSVENNDFFPKYRA